MAVFITLLLKNIIFYLIQVGYTQGSIYGIQKQTHRCQHTIKI